MHVSDQEKEKRCHYAVQGWKILTALAKQQKENPGKKILPLTYKQLGNKLRPKLYHRLTRRALGPIQHYVEEKELPWLNSLVVRSGDKLPGDGYDGPTRRNDLKDDQNEAYEYEWDNINPSPNFDDFMQVYKPNR